MRAPLWRLGALALLLSVPASAAFVSVDVAPVLGLARSAPAFRASLISQIRAVNSLSAATSPNMASLAAAAPTAADPWHAQSAQVVGALAAQPAAVAAHRAELAAALDDASADMLVKAAKRLEQRRASDAALDAQLHGFARALDFSNADSVADFGARLNAFFENSRSRPEDAPLVAAGEGPGRAPLVGLVKPGEKPAMSAAELEAYVEKNGAVSPRGLKRVNFASGDYRPEYDAALKRLGVDQVVIKSPSRAELAKFKEEDGYHLKSEYVRWVMTTRTLEEHKAALGKAQRVRQFEHQLDASKDIPTEIGPLTVEKYEQWYPIYEDEVVGKPGGKRNVALDFARKLADKGQLDKGWYGLFYYDPQDRTRMIGGVIMKAAPDRGMFILGYAAYRPDLKDASPSVRTFVEGMKIAQSLGLKVYSFGQDTNFFGYDYNLGLMMNKAGFLLTPYPEVTSDAGDEMVLLKQLDTSKIAEVKNASGKNGGYLFFGIKRDSPYVERVLAAQESGAERDPQALLGGKYFTPEILPAKDTTVALYYRGDDPNPVRTPAGIDVVQKPMAPPSSGQ